jgi:hypothetical protein
MPKRGVKDGSYRGSSQASSACNVRSICSYGAFLQGGTGAIGRSSSSTQSSSATPSPASKNSPATDSSSSSNTTAGVPQSVIATVESYVSPAQRAWNTLTQTLRLGGISAAQTALNDYIAALPATQGTTGAPSGAFLNDLTALGDSLQAGDLANARTAFASAQNVAPLTADQAVYWSQSQASLDGWIAVYALEHAQIIHPEQLASDISGVDSALREEGSYITSALVAQGYNQPTAANYASEITGISSSETAQENSQVDAARSAQWIQGLIGISQGTVSSPGYSNLQAPSSAPASSAATQNAVSDELSSILFRQRQQRHHEQCFHQQK